jgi:cyclohexanecarboxylate-CoA ligase
MMRALTEIADEWARQRPGEPAVIDGPRAWTWEQLARRVDAAADLLMRIGVRPGEIVAYQLPNCGEFVVFSLAVLKAGAACCPLMPFYRQREVAHILARTSTRFLVIPGSFRGRDYLTDLGPVLEAAGHLEHVIIASEARPAGHRAERRPACHYLHDPGGYPPDHDRSSPPRVAAGSQRDGIAQVMFTSGTAGEPKAVVHRQDVLTASAVLATRRLGLGASDSIFVPSPLAHQTGFLYGMWQALVLGVPQVLQAVWDPVAALTVMNTWGCTFVQAATPFLVDLVRAVEAGAPPPRALRIFVASGAAIPREQARRATRVLGADVCGAWGSTETGLGTLTGPTDDPLTMWGTDGRALDGVQIRVTGDHGLVLRAGREGHLEVKTPTAFASYLDRPEMTARAFTPDSWYRTGDLGVIDELGYLRVTGRVTDMINRGGEKIPVGEIEELLASHPGVADVALVAIPHDRLGEQACAFVVTSAGRQVTLPGLQDFLDARQVAKQYWPEHLEIIRAMPRTASGKIRKQVLRDRARALGTRAAS